MMEVFGVARRDGSFTRAQSVDIVCVDDQTTMLRLVDLEGVESFVNSYEISAITMVRIAAVRSSDRVGFEKS